MTDKITDNINNNFLFGCVKYNKKYKFYLMPLAYWILNYSKYDPSYNPDKWDLKFRENILNVNDYNIDLFLRAIEIDKININDIIKYNFKDIFLFFIDFDFKRFISDFDEITFEDYLPNDKWKYIFNSPIDYLPNDLVMGSGTD